MRRSQGWRQLVVVASLAGAVALAVRPSEAQEAPGLTFDIRMSTGDSAAGAHQTGRGWIAEKRTRVDLRGGGTAQAPIPGLPSQDVSMITHDSGDAPVVLLVLHDTRKFMYPNRMMEQLKEMMESLTEKPKMTFSVTNLVVDTLGAGEMVSGFATRRYRVKADISMAIEMMGESVNQTMRVESEGDFAEELSAYSDPLRDTRGFKSLLSGMPWADSSSMAEMEKLVRATPRGLALRQVDRVTGVGEGGESVQTTTTAFSNIKRGSIPLATFAIPEGYTEMDMPMVPSGVN